MSNYDDYPYTEYTELNLDATLQQIKELKERATTLENSLTNIKNRLTSGENGATTAESDNAASVSRETSAGARLTALNNRHAAIKANLNNRAQSVTYENTLTEDETAKAVKAGTLNVRKANALQSTDVLNVKPTGVLGNCVIWANPPFNGTGTARQVSGQTFSGNQVIQYAATGATLICSHTAADGAQLWFRCNGVGYYVGENFVDQSLQTDEHLDIFTTSGTNGNYDTFIPSTPNTEYAGGSVTVTNSTPVSQTIDSGHLYAYSADISRGGNSAQTAGYILNGTLHVVRTFTDTDDYYPWAISIDDGTLNITTDGKTDGQAVLYFCDLGGMA